MTTTNTTNTTTTTTTGRTAARIGIGIVLFRKRL
jgi:hypothetical protein